MTSLAAQIRTGLATNVGTVPSLYQRTHALVPDKVNTPCAIVNLPSWDYHQPHSRVLAEVLILAAPLGKGQERAQTKLDDYLDDDAAESVKAAIESDKTLGGVVADVIVRGWSEYGDVEVNGIAYLGAVLNVEIAAT